MNSPFTAIGRLEHVVRQLEHRINCKADDCKILDIKNSITRLQELIESLRNSIYGITERMQSLEDWRNEQEYK